jgi:formylglycine-generating enzyme required for sulfatase activity
MVLVAPSAATGAGTLEPGQIFRDCPECPELVVIAAGEYQMGSDENAGDGIPAHQVRLPAPFAMGRFEVTFDQWRNCIDDGGCSHRPSDWGWSGEHPVVNVSWPDAQQYLRWLSKKTGRVYRLPFEAEWEYAARAGTQTHYWWGDEIGAGNARCDGCGTPKELEGPLSIGSFPANGFGLHDTQGNVWEWVGNYWCGEATGIAAADGALPAEAACNEKVLRGGGWTSHIWRIQSTSRHSAFTATRGQIYGFRVLREF